MPLPVQWAMGGVGFTFFFLSGGGFDECGCGWVFSGIANQLWLFGCLRRKGRNRGRGREREIVY